MEKKTYYEEARRYMENAKDSLNKTIIEDGFYKDEKYVKQAAGIAYAGLEKAARWWLELRGYKQPLSNFKEINKGLSMQDGTAQKLFHTGYVLLHQDAYYNDITKVSTIKEGMGCATEFIQLLKGYSTLLPEDTKSNLQKRRLLRNH